MDREWDYNSQEHKDSSIYSRYHYNIYLPDEVREAAERFLPQKGEPLTLSTHYKEIQAARKLPKDVYMPYAYHIVDVTVFKAANAIFRVLIRAPWNKAVDIAMVLEGDFEIVTAFWVSPGNGHDSLDETPYERWPIEEVEEVLDDA